MMSRTNWWLVGALMAVIAITVGVIVEEVGRGRDRNRYPQVGTSYEVGGRTLNLFCLFEEGVSYQHTPATREEALADTSPPPTASAG
jgi:hypothetical protein